MASQLDKADLSGFQTPDRSRKGKWW